MIEKTPLRRVCKRSVKVDQNCQLIQFISYMRSLFASLLNTPFYLSVNLSDNSFVCNLNKNRTNTKDVQMRIFRDKYIVNECICVFEWELVFEYDFLSSLWFEKKPLFSLTWPDKALRLGWGGRMSPLKYRKKRRLWVLGYNTHTEKSLF